MNKLRSIFKPTAEEEIKHLEHIIKCHMDNIGHCVTCVHYYANLYLPGFVTDYGECRSKVDIFPEKVCSHRDVVCESYEEDKDSIELFNVKIKRMKGE